MRIKKLEISGFKSFADKARLNFGDGITGVVGPNGCGKSNVVDAIRWVMGEMSAKHLRGRAMQDVIFAGAQNRGAQGMAEVTLTFDNDGNVPPSFLNFSEIAVTRRLFRDGSSEYLINKAPVRLRDITDLFLGTGVGTRAYSIIEQGRIGFVVNSRPEERRSLIEEVAGITKFKVRKKAAERRMEATEQNLARVCDVVTELDRQLQTLRKQARKAERYREMRGALRDIELHRAVLDLLRLSVTKHVHEGEVVRLASAISDNQRDVATEESDLAAKRLALIEQEQALSQMQAETHAQDQSVAGLERDLGHWRSQIHNVQQAGDRAAQDVADARVRLAQCEEERTRLHAEAESLTGVAEHDEAALREAERSVQDAADQLMDMDEQLAALREDAMTRVQGATKRRAEAQGLERQRLEVETQLVRAQSERDTLLPEQAAVATRATLLSNDEAIQREGLHKACAARDALHAQLPIEREALRDGAQTLQALRDTLGTRRSRLESLSQIVQRLEGYSDGVRHLLGGEDGADAPASVPGIIALVAEVIEVQPDHERAIEAVLGDALQYLLVEDSAAAAGAIAHLEAVQGGRGGFIPRQVAPYGRTLLGPAPTGAGHLGMAAQAVRCSQDAEGLIAYLLGHVCLVDTLATAQQAAALHTGHTFVTAQGEVVDGGGTALGGSDNGAGLLATRREIRDLTQHVATLTEDHNTQAQAHAARTDKVQAAEASLVALAQEVHERELTVTKQAKDLEALHGEQERLADRCARLTADVAARQEALENLADEEERARQDADAAEAGQEDVAWQLSEMQERRGAYASQHSGHQADLTAVRVRQASQAERVAASAQAQTRLQATIDDLTARIARAADTSADTQSQVDALHQSIAQGEAQLQQLVLKAQASGALLLEARAQYEAEQSHLLGHEQALREARKDENGLADALVQARMTLQRLVLETDALIATIQERHDVVLAHVVHLYHDKPEPNAQAIAEQSELERAIKAMGPINLTAIEECAEVEGRFQFLSGQRDDLQNALDALKLAIMRINRTSRERFKEAFDAVNAMFQKIYPRLFRGGVARLELTNADDLLEAGVDIIAMPPGKKLQSVGLLSGGEKALTATALVFAIFLIKPSPFCILDEVDAPLDEANVGRFNEMLREISQVSQFIVITHNKQTMLQMDRLYGITMEEPGMSKVVTVDLDDRQSNQAA